MFLSGINGGTRFFCVTPFFLDFFVTLFFKKCYFFFVCYTLFLSFSVTLFGSIEVAGRFMRKHVSDFLWNRYRSTDLIESFRSVPVLSEYEQYLFMLGDQTFPPYFAAKEGFLDTILIPVGVTCWKVFPPRKYHAEIEGGGDIACSPVNTTQIKKIGSKNLNIIDGNFEHRPILCRC